jgi:hypothetical protein
MNFQQEVVGQPQELAQVEMTYRSDVDAIKDWFLTQMRSFFVNDYKHVMHSGAYLK